MAKLINQRSASIIGGAIRVKIFVDGKEVGSVRRKQTKEFHLQDSKHILSVKSRDTRRSAPVEFVSNSDKIFLVRPHSAIIWVIFYLILILILNSATRDNGTPVIPQFAGQFTVAVLFISGILFMILLGYLRKGWVIKEAKDLNHSLL
jgi:hypothetical protein